MPMDRKKYPENWEEISKRIRVERADGRCEQCYAPNGEYILRPLASPAEWLVLESYKLSEIDEAAYKIVRVVLTVHHIGVPKPDGTPGSPHDKMDCREENLIALCQRCHLLADQPHHIAKARETKLRKKHERIKEAGQNQLL